MVNTFRSLACSALLFFAAPAWAQWNADSTVRLPEATVEAERGATSGTAAVSRVTSLRIGQQTREESRSLADLLDTSTGLYIRRYGPSGTASVAFRGTDPSQTEILLDGLRITDPQSGQVDLSLIPIVLLESVEILHGSGSSPQSSGGLGGTVRLHTLKMDGAGRARMRLGSGAYGRRNVSGMAGGEFGRIAVIAAAEHVAEDGRFPYVNRAVVPAEATTRVGADVQATSVFAKASVKGPVHRAAIAGWYNHVERGLPGPGNAPPVPSRQVDEHLRTWLTSHHRIQTASITTNWSLQKAALRYTNEATATDDRTETTSFESRIGANVPIGTALLLQSGVDWTEHRAGGIREDRLAAFVSTIAETTKLIIETSVRVEGWHAPSGTRRQVVPRAGVNVKRFLHPALRLKMSAGRSWTVPSLIERFWVPGGNPNLRPESGWSADAGLLLGVAPIDLEMTGFVTDLRDRIVWIPSLVGAGVQVWRPTNVGKATTYGLEVSASTEASLGATSRLKTGITISYTEARDRSDPEAAAFGHQLKYVPRLVGTAFSGLSVRKFHFGLTGQLVGRRYVTSDETSSLSPYAVFGGRASYEADLGALAATLSLTAENVFDNTYSTIRFYPMPPRHFGIALNLEWSRSEW